MSARRASRLPPMRLPTHSLGDGAGAHVVRVPGWPYLVTPLCVASAWPLTALAHQAWSASPWASAGLTVAGGSLTALTYVAARPRGKVKRLVATTLAGGSSLWVLGATICGPWTHPWLDTWAMGGITASAAVAIMRVLAQGRSDDDRATSPAGGLAEAVKSLRAAKLSPAAIEGAKASTVVELPQGEVISDVERDREAIASALDVNLPAVRVLRDPDSVRRGSIEVVPVDQLREKVVWRGPSAPGQSVGAAPLRFALAEDGEAGVLWLTGEQGVRPAVHVRITGMTGAGKGETALVLLGDYLTRTDGFVIAIDTVKGRQTLDPVHEGIGLFVVDDESADDVLTRLAEDVIPARTAALAEEGLKEWAPTSALSHLLVWVEESAAWSDHDALVAIAERARSAGVCLVMSQQRWTHDRAPTSLRAQFAASVCFGIDPRDDPNLALPPAAVDAGAAPETWGASNPGYLYLAAPGISTQRLAIPHRGEIADPHALTHTLRSWAARRRPLDQVTARALGPSLANNTTDGATTARAGRATWPQLNTNATPRPADHDERDERDERDTDPPVRPGVNPTDPPNDVDPSVPLHINYDGPRLHLPLVQRITPQQAREMLRETVRFAADDGRHHIRPAELGDVLAETGMSAQWLSKALRELCDGPDALLRVPTERGVYPIRIGLAHAE